VTLSPSIDAAGAAESGGTGASWAKAGAIHRAALAATAMKGLRIDMGLLIRISCPW
jgi:hypothetical protein